MTLRRKGAWGLTSNVLIPGTDLTLFLGSKNRRSIYRATRQKPAGPQRCLLPASQANGDVSGPIPGSQHPSSAADRWMLDESDGAGCADRHILGKLANVLPHLIHRYALLLLREGSHHAIAALAPIWASALPQSAWRPVSAAVAQGEYALNLVPLPDRADTWPAARWKLALDCERFESPRARTVTPVSGCCIMLTMDVTVTGERVRKSLESPSIDS